MPFAIRGQRLFFENQCGQAVTELALMMTFLAVVLLGMVVVSDFASKNVAAVEKLRFDMRVSMHENAGGAFSRRIMEEVVMVEVPGRMKQVFRTPFLSKDHRVEFYEGSYTGRGINYYLTRDLVRNVDLQD